MSLTKVSYSMVSGAPANVLDFGADPTGVADSTAAITAAIAASTVVFFPLGTYKVTSTINLSSAVTLYSEGSGYTYNPDLGTGQSGATIDCSGITGYLFNVVLGLNTNVPGPYIKGLMFTGNSSATWLGVIKATPNAGSSSSAVQQLVMEDCGMSGSTAATSAMVLYSSFDRPKFVRCAFSAISGRAINNSFLVGGSVTTIVEFDQCKFVYCRQVFSVYATVKIQFNTCSFESSTVVGVLANTAAEFNNCYYENIGQTWGGYTTGIENKDLGFSGGTILQTPITSVLNIAGSEVTFPSCVFNYRNNAHAVAYPESSNVYVVGLATGLYTGCYAKFIGCRILNNNVAAFFETQALAQQNLNTLAWDGGIFSPTLLKYTDMRKLDNGSLYVDFSGGANPAQPTHVFIKNKKFVFQSVAFDYPSASPVGGAYEIGDICYPNTLGSGYVGAVCTVAGSPGTWKYFGAIV